MQTTTKMLSTLLLIPIGCMSIALSFSTKAHLMVAQHGTLNMVGEDVFMVLSLPVSAFEGIDDNNDNKLSMSEFKMHQSAITKAVKQRIILSDDKGIRPIKGLLLSPVAGHDSPNEPATQLIVMGRYSLTDVSSALHYHFDLFGKSSEEKRMEITATRRSDRLNTILRFTPKTSAAELFVSGDVLPLQKRR